MISVQEADFDTGEEIAKLCAGRTDTGAVVSFTGLVRDFSDTTAVSSLTLEYYPGMTERQLEKLAREARNRWNLQALRVIHRYGPLVPGDRIVLVVTASAHRKDAFEAAEFLMDWLKTKAPFWKKETGPEGSRWVEQKQEDRQAAKKWEKIQA